MPENMPETVREQFDGDAHQFTIDVSGVVDDNDDFNMRAIPYTMGYCTTNGYGITDINYGERTITFTKVADE